MSYAPQEYPNPASTPTSNVAYASWIQRVGAYLVDTLVTVPFSVAAIVLGQDTDPVSKLPSYNTLYWVFNALALAVWGFNRWYLSGKTGQSWGKKALGLRLVGETSGQPIGIGMAFVRDLAHIVDSVICLIGYLFPLWDAKKQTIADKLVKTLVVR